jgi:uncharacterized membrane protein
MNFPDGLFNDVWAFGAILPYALIMAWALLRAPWRRLSDSRQVNVWMGTIVVLMVIWSLKAGVKPGLNLHLLGATAFTLMFGRQLALIGLSCVLAAVTFNAGLHGISAWQPFALNALALVVFPVFLTHAILRAVERWLPAHIFIFIFVVAFLGAAVTALATGALTSLLLWFSGAYAVAVLLYEYLPFYLLLGFSEAWLNGAAITLMILYFPHWVGSFDDRRYLGVNK